MDPLSFVLSEDSLRLLSVMKWQKTFLTWFVLKMANNADSATHQEYYYIISIRYSINERENKSWPLTIIFGWSVTSPANTLIPEDNSGSKGSPGQSNWSYSSYLGWLHWECCPPASTLAAQGQPMITLTYDHCFTVVCLYPWIWRSVHLYSESGQVFKGPTLW